MIKPIKPQEVIHTIPDFIIEAVNGLIQKKWDGEEAIIKQDEIMELVTSDDSDDDKPSHEEVYKRHWLDFEPLYEEVGWNVEYDKPGFNEFYKPYFRFTKQK